MRILVSGATGFIGAALSDALKARGDEVVTLTRHQPAPGQVGIDLDAGTLDTSRLEGGTLTGTDAAVHLAGASIIGRWTAARREEIRSSRIAIGDVIARALAGLDAKPSVLVSGSAVGYYGDGGEAVLDEKAEAGHGFLPDVCRAWEAAMSPASDAGIRCVAIRTGVVLGKGGALAPQLKLFRLGLGGNLGSGKQWMSWVSLDDEVGAILRAIDDDSLSGPVNATSPNPCRNSEFTATLAAAVKRPAVLAVPPIALRSALGRGPADEMLLVSQRVVPNKLSTSGYRFVHPDLEGALAAAIS